MTEPEPRAPAQRTWTRVALSVGRVSVVVAIFAILGWTGRLPLDVMWRSLAQPAFLVVLAAQALAIGLNAFRWVLILKAVAPELPAGAGWLVALRAHFTTLVLPNVGGSDAVRLGALRHVGPEVVGGSLLADRAIALLGLGAALAGSLVMARGLGLDGRLAFLWASAWLIVAGIAAAPLVMMVSARWLAGTKVRWLGSLRTALEHALRTMRRWSTSVPALLLAVLSMLVGNASVALALVLGGAAHGEAAFVISPLVTLAMALPVTPQGLGVGESTAEWLYGSAGIAGGAAALVVVRLGWVLATLLTGVTWLWAQKTERPRT